MIEKCPHCGKPIEINEEEIHIRIHEKKEEERRKEQEQFSGHSRSFLDLRRTTPHVPEPIIKKSENYE